MPLRTPGGAGAMRVARVRSVGYRRAMARVARNFLETAVGVALKRPACAGILCRLQDGRARTAIELARVAGVDPGTTRRGLGMLVRWRLVRVAASGRHRYYSLNEPAVGVALQAQARDTHCAAAPLPTRLPAGLRAARTCYRHLAGTLGVALCARWLELGWLQRAAGYTDDYEVSPAGAAAFGQLGVDLAAVRRQPRRFAYACLDCSERRPHLAGALGDGVFASMTQHGWLRRVPGTRGIAVTPAGRHALRDWCGVDAAV